MMRSGHIRWPREPWAGGGGLRIIGDRAFEADDPVGGKDDVPLFVERRVESPGDFGHVSEGYGFELFVLDEEGEIAVSLYERVVARDDLLKLSGWIEERNDRARAFFASFDESGAA
jgi:hypothetical protein